MFQFHKFKIMLVHACNFPRTSPYFSLTYYLKRNMLTTENPFHIRLTILIWTRDTLDLLEGPSTPR